MASYSADSDLHLVYGESNIDAWADTENTNLPKVISDRKTWARETAYAILNARLRNGLYRIPITGTVPAEVKHLEALYAGILLYDNRRLALQDDNKDRVLPQRRMFEKMVNQIISGQMKLDLTHKSKTYPEVSES